MQKKKIYRLAVLILLIALLPACALFNPDTKSSTPTAPALTTTPLPTMGAMPQPGAQPVQIRGEFTYTNDFVMETYFVEHMAALVDMHGFVLRDQEWLIPVESQTPGYLKVIPDEMRGTFWLQLPAQPAGVYNDVDNDGSQDTGVQIFAVTYWPNLAGGPYSDGEDPSRGWPSYMASVKIDTENQDEVMGGRIVVWSPDDQQQFPTGFGSDGLLFTPDDPTAPVAPGYSVIDLDQQPFGVILDREPSMTLYEPADVAIKDFSDLSYSEAFDRLFETVKKEYAFNGITGKQPDYERLYAELGPRIKEAENRRDGYAFYEAMVEFTYAFKDGHVGLSGSGTYDAQYFDQRAAGGYGLAVRELDDGRVIATYVLNGGPAGRAGIQVGDEITAVNDRPAADAIGAVQPLSAPHSSDFAMRYQQARYLLRGKIGDQARISFKSGGEAVKTADLTAIDERQSLSATSLYLNYDQNRLPVDFMILETGTGYVRVNSNNDDLNLIVRLFQRALKTFESQGITNLIIDMRMNFGGSPLGLAGFLTGQTIDLGQLEYYSERSGKFEPEGTRDKFYPYEEQYTFDKIALLVDQTCFSACEIEAYGFSQLPGIIVVGQYPTAGVEAEVARGQFLLPDGLSLQLPTGRFTLPDGSLFLEGSGVQPVIKVPVTAETVLSGGDVVLQAAEKALAGN